MVDYIKFWLAQYFVAVSITLLSILILFVAALWSIRGEKFYKEPKGKQ